MKKSKTYLVVLVSITTTVVSITSPVALQASYDIVQTRHDILKASYDILQARHEILQASHEILQARHEILKASYDILQARHEILQARHDILQTSDDILQARHDILQATHVAPFFLRIQIQEEISQKFNVNGFFGGAVSSFIIYRDLPLPEV